MSRKSQLEQDRTRNPELLSHIASLGLSTIDEYRDWCARNGFSTKLSKNWKQLGRERFQVTQEIARKRLSDGKRERRRPMEVLTGICNGQLTEADVTQPHLKRLCEIALPAHDSRADRPVNRIVLLKLLGHLHRVRAKLFDDAVVDGNTTCGYLDALACVAAYAGSAVRPIDTWKPQSRSAPRQFASLLRHMFARYDDVPLFFDSAWFQPRSREGALQRNWYLHVGDGQSVRTCSFPIALTRQMAAHFKQAPSDLSVLQAIRWAQVRGLGGDVSLARAVLETRLRENFAHNEFWESVFRWLIRYPEFERAQVGPAIDYLHNQKFVAQRVPLLAGDNQVAQPLQPNLSMAGRTPASLMRQIHEWHRRLAATNQIQVQQWKPSGIDGFEFYEGSDRSNNLRCWTIRELLSSKALYTEGRQLKHCVASYAAMCSRGHCSIWTLEVESFEGRNKLITIEVSNQSRTICQARGKLNRLPTEKEWGLIRRWATSSSLRLSVLISR